MATRLWATEERDAPWSLLIFISDLVPIEINPLDFNRFFGYDESFKPSRALSFFKIREEKVRGILEDYGSIEVALRSIPEAVKKVVDVGTKLKPKESENGKEVGFPPRDRDEITGIHLSSLVENMKGHEEVLNEISEILGSGGIEYNYLGTIVSADGELRTILSLRRTDPDPLGGLLTVKTDVEGSHSFELEVIGSTGESHRSLDDLIKVSAKTERTKDDSKSVSSTSEEELLKDVLEVIRSEINIITSFRRVIGALSLHSPEDYHDLMKAYWMIKQSLIDTETSFRRCSLIR